MPAAAGPGPAGRRRWPGAALLLLPLLWAPLLGHAQDAGLDAAGLEAAAPDDAAPAELVADLIELREGRIHGSGNVVVTRGDERIACASFTYDPDTGLLEVVDGQWVRPSGTATFQTALLDLDQREGEVGQARIVGRDGEVFIEGERLRWAADGRLEGERLRVTTCGCERPLWEISARRVVVIPDESLRFRGGVVHILGLPLLPLPAGRLPLRERASGLLPPRVGTGQDGLLVGLPAWLALGEHADLGLEPELRTARGARLRADGRWQHLGGGGEARLVGGWDWQEESARGAAALEEGLARGPWRLGIDAQVEGDRTYLEDYGDAFLSRRRPWAETLGVAGFGPLRLEHDGFQSLGQATVQGQRPLGGVFSLAGRRIGPLAVDAAVRTDVIGQGTDPWQVDPDPQARVQADVGAEVGRQLGPVRVEGRAAGSTIGWSDAQPWGVGELTGRAWLPAWSELPGGRLIGEWGLIASGSRQLGQVAPRMAWDQPPPLWSLGPAVTGRLLTAGGVPLSGAGRLAWTDRGFEPEGWLRADLGPWSLRTGARPELQELRFGFDDGRLALGSTALRADALLQSRLDGAWTLPGPLSEWRPGYQAFLDVEDGDLLSHGPRLSFTSRCDCLSFATAVTWSQDRERPDFGLQLQVP